MVERIHARIAWRTCGSSELGGSGAAQGAESWCCAGTDPAARAMGAQSVLRFEADHRCEHAGAGFAGPVRRPLRRLMPWAVAATVLIALSLYPSSTDLRREPL